MQQAFRKYASQPTIKQHSIASIDAFPKPLIYVCNNDQFKYGKARELGYETYTDFLQGEVTGSELPSWLGNSHNKTFDELVKTLFNDDYTDLRLENAEQKLVFIQPFGFCLQLFNFSTLHSKQLQVYSNKTVKFLILDPYRGNKITAEEEFGQITTLDAKYNSNEYLHFKVLYTLHDNSFYDGIECTDYSKLTTTYGDCFENEVERNLNESYGCIPKWFPGNMTKCTKSSQPFSNATLHYIEQFSNHRHINQECKNPCRRLEMQLKRVGRLSNYPTHSVLNLRHRRLVIVHKTVNAYDIFSLIVELGSSLGLWMGMSAVGLLDIFIENFMRIQEAVALKTKNLLNRNKQKV